MKPWRRGGGDEGDGDDGGGDGDDNDVGGDGAGDAC